MSDLSAQKRLAADILDVGENRVWLDPERQGDIVDAITRDDVRELIEEGAIEAEAKRGNSRGRARERQAKRAYGHRTGPGSRKGKQGGRQSRKEQWESDVRAQRRRLKELREEGELAASEYRELYAMASGGEFDSVADIERYMEDDD